MIVDNDFFCIVDRIFNRIKLLGELKAASTLYHPMIQRVERFLTTHTGSLPRSADLTGMMLAKDSGAALDRGFISAIFRPNRPSGYCLHTEHSQFESFGLTGCAKLSRGFHA
jgi:hypothetical protein